MASRTRSTGVSSAPVEPAIPSGSNRTASLAAFLLLTTALVPTAAFSGDALPQGGSFTHGNGTITQGGSRVDVKQSSDAGIVNWGSFSIGSGNQVHFDNGAGATLNRVTGNVPSRIDGSLSATGSVFLVNPAGVAVGSGGLVSTGGSFVASTQDVTDSDFLNGGGLTFSGTSGAEVVNAGTIRSAQGDIALIARRVENSGTLEAPNGTAALAAGYEVLMKDVADADGLLSVKLGGADTEALNSGTIAAANAEIRANGGNVFALAGNTDGVVKATGVSTSGGRIFLTAGNTGKVQVSGKLKSRKLAENVPVPGAKPATEGGAITVTGGEITITGTLDASAEESGVKGGEIVVFSEDTASVSGTLSARGGVGGEGGFVETSARNTIDFAGITVDTSSDGGQTGLWLIDPVDLTVDAAAAATISSNLASNNVSLQTTNSSASGPGNQSAGDGNITINSGITWTSTNTLTLNAYNDIAINAAIDGQNGGLTLLAYGNSGTAAVGTISTGAAGAVDVDNFALTRGVWDQVGAGLPDFATNALSVGFGTFIRAQGGDGTFSNPYALFDVYGLQGITTSDRRGGGSGDISLYYELANDIDASMTSSWNNGAGFDPVSFSGSLDGKGHTIDGLYINRPSEGNVALISYWQDNYFTSGRDLEIKDLTLTNASVTGDNQTAILVGDTGGGNYHGHNMSNVTVSGTVQANSWGAGVVARYFGNIDQSTMTNVHADVSVTTTDGGSATGGLVAIMGEGLIISNSSSTGSITGGQVGGLVGTTDDNDNRIENSYSTATVTSSGSFREAGGLVGYAEDLTISNSYFAGQVLGTNGAAAGGLIGTADRNTVIENSFVTGLVEAEGYAAALVAEVSDSSVSITDTAWDTETTGQTEVIGYTNSYTPTVTNTSGLTTSQMQGSLTLGGFTLDSSIWGTGSGLFPYFKWEYAATPEAVSGIVYSDAGTTAQTGANVSALSGGNLVGSAVSGANGHYYILTTAGSLNSAGVLSYLDGESTKAATFADTVTSTGVSGADIWGNAFNVNTGAAAMTDVVTALDTTIGAFSDTDLDFLFNTSAVVRTDQNGNSLDFNLNATSNFNLDNNLYAGGNLTVATNGTFSVGDSNAILWAHDGDLTVNGDVAWSNSNQLSLYADASNASIKINGSVTAPNGKLRVDQTSSATNVTSTATGDIHVDDFQSDTAWLQVGSSLPDFYARDFDIQGGHFVRALGGDGSQANPYQIFDVYSLQGIQSGSGTTPVNYVLTRNIDASGTAAWNGGSGFASTSLRGNFDGGGYTIDGLTSTGNFSSIGLFGVVRADGQDVSIRDLKLTNVNIAGGVGVGGLIGAAVGGKVSVSDVSVGGTVTGAGNVGGVAGIMASEYSVTDTHSSADVTTTAYAAGGLIGNSQTSDASQVTRSSASGNVSGRYDIGGLMGRVSNVDVSRSHASGTVTLLADNTGGTTTPYGAGGLIGSIDSGSVDLSYATGTVQSSDNVATRLGGLVAYSVGAPITRSFATGDVIHTGSMAGGLVGVTASSISDSYATGDVSGSNEIGGLVGRMLDGSSVTRSYATGAVSASVNGGGLVGTMDAGTITLTNSVWDTQTTGLNNAVGDQLGGSVTNVTGVTSSAMQQLDTFVAAGFGIDDQGGTANTWRIYEGQTTPLLRGFLTAITVTGDDKSKVYDGTVYSGGFTYALSSAGASLLGSFDGGAAVTATAAGNYAIGNSFYSHQFGYDIVSIDGTLTIISPSETSGSSGNGQSSTDPRQRVLERNRLQTPDTDEALEDNPSACEPGVVGGEGAVHPCNRSFGRWLSAAAE